MLLSEAALAGCWRGWAAARIRLGVTPFGVPNDGYLEMARLIAGGGRFDPLILVSAAPGEDLVVMEGHCRLTAHMLAGNLLPPELEVLVGYSAGITRWDVGDGT
jgi:hypothetical protein